MVSYRIRIAGLGVFQRVGNPLPTLGIAEEGPHGVRSGEALPLLLISHLPLRDLDVNRDHLLGLVLKVGTQTVGKPQGHFRSLLDSASKIGPEPPPQSGFQRTNENPTRFKVQFAFCK